MKRPERGISMGTIVMTALTAVVLIASAAIFPRLMGSADLDIDVGGVLAALTLDEGLPELSLHEIPIANATATPEAGATPAAVTPTPAPTATPTPTPTAIPGGKVTLTLGGTVNIDEDIRQSAYYSDSKKYDFTDMMALLHGEMDSDLTLLTLENLTDGASKVSSLNAPEAVMDMLADAGVNVLALGFSDALDKGSTALNATIQAARERDMTTLGAYATQQDASELRIFTIDSVDVAILHYTDALSSSSRKNVNSENVAYALPLADADAMAYDIRQARAAGADVVVVSLNWGKTSASKPTDVQKKLAQSLADAGADIIVGAGTRVVQPVTWLTAKDEAGNIRQALCAWSLGSLINESRKDGNVVGMLLQVNLAYDGSSLSFERVSYTPTYIWRYKQAGQWQYRIAVSDQPPPDGMSDDQTGYMEKAYRNIQRYLDGSPITLREK